MFLSGRLKYLPVLAAGVSFAFLMGCDNPSAMNQSSGNVKHITQADFADEVTRCSTPVVVEFYATWCGPCRELAPLLDRAAGGYTGKIRFVKVNVDESPGLAQNYQVEQVPLVLMFRKGNLADKVLGVPAEADLKSKLDALSTAK